MIPFNIHALFIGNINTGWIRYLDFTNVEPIGNNINNKIYYINFSLNNKYLYLCLTKYLTILNTNNFQPILNIKFTDLQNVIPCDLIRTPPSQEQIELILNKYIKKNNYKNNNNTTYIKNELKKKLESMSIIFSSTKTFLDPRVFIYKFPMNKCKVITQKKGSKKSNF